jgi:predicted phosphoribosyltransferase
VFADRASAGRELAERIAPRLAARRARIYGLARGGVIVGRSVADRLGLSLEVVIACKVGAPGQRELAVGAVAEGGGEAWDAELLDALGLDPGWCADAKRDRLDEVDRRRRLYRDRPLVPGLDELAIVVDDGIATGSTVLAAVRGLRALGVERCAVAAPVAAREALERFGPEAEWVAVAEIPERFGAVGAHYVRFEAVPDEDLLIALAQVPPARVRADSWLERSRGR